MNDLSAVVVMVEENERVEYPTTLGEIQTSKPLILFLTFLHPHSFIHTPNPHYTPPTPDDEVVHQSSTHYPF